MDERRPVQKEGVDARKVGDEWLLYDAQDGSIHVVNATAARVWGLCDGAHSVAEMEQALRDAYADAQGSPVGDHVEAVVKQFSDLGIIRFTDA